MSLSHENRLKFSDKISDYEFGSLIGVGSFGRVYRAKCVTKTSDGSKQTLDCALKCISKKSSPNIGKIHTEVSIHLRLKNEHILQLYNAIEDAEHVYLVLEVCDGGSLAQYLRGKVQNSKNPKNYHHIIQHLKKSQNHGDKDDDCNKILDPIISYSTIRIVMKQICLGLDYLHRNSIVHRDLNLNNLLLFSPPQDCDSGSDFVIKIADFGLAIDLNSSNQNNLLSHKHHRDDHVIPMPAGTTICGTPGFISPEVWSQMQTVSPASDIFSIGSILFSLISGYTPKGELDLSSYSPMAGDLISRLLAPDPNDRPSIDNVLKHPFMIGPFNTKRLSSINKLTKTIQLSINDEGSVKLNFIKNQSSIEISKDGELITVSNHNGKGKGFTLETLPSCHWKKYIYAWRFVELVKAKTPKVTVHCYKDDIINSHMSQSNNNSIIVKGCIMENGDFEATILDTLNNNSYKMLIDDNVSKCDNNMRKQLIILRNKCIEIEKKLTDTCVISQIECFPSNLGRKYITKGNDNTQITVSSSTVSSHILRSANIKGIGVATQLSNGIIQVTFADGSSMSLASNSQIIYSSHNGVQQRFHKHDPLPESIKHKLALLPQAVDQLRHQMTSV